MRITTLMALSLFFFTMACGGCPPSDSTTTAADGQEGALPADDDRFFVTWHQRRIQDLRGPDDLSPIVEMAGQRELILLADTSYGTAEYYDLRADLTLAIAEGPGLDFVAIEADWIRATWLDRYARGQGDPDDINQVLSEHFQSWPSWRWANEEFADFMRRIRAFNDENPGQPIRVYGVDTGGLFESIDRLHQLTRFHHPERLDEMAEHLECLGQYGPDLRGYAQALHDRQHHHHGHGHHGHDHHGHDHDHAHHPSSGTCQEPIEAAFALTQELFVTNGTDDVTARKLARAIRATESHQRARDHGDPTTYWNTQSIPVFEIITGLLTAHGDDARGVVWGHVNHMADTRGTDRAARGNVNTGSLARENLGEEAVLIVGFSTYRGTVIAATDTNQPHQVFEVPEPQEESLDDLMHRPDGPDHFIVMTAEDRDLHFWDPLPRQRSMVDVYNPQREQFGNYFRTNLAQRYDVIVFIEETSAVNPL